MIIIGGGVAGLMAALAAAPHPVTLVNPTTLGPGAASWLSQGGIAAAVGDDDDVSLHIKDTLEAGAGLCNPDVVARIISAGPAVIDTLLAYGVTFDRTGSGARALGLEAAHSRKRILHGGGDRTGATIMKALIEKVQRCPSINIIQASAERIFVDDNGVSGIQIQRDGHMLSLKTDRVLLATGGIGGLFRDTTNPPSAVGQGLILAMEAGAEFKDLEFVQFHPTALAVKESSLPLVSEAVRGEGARLVDEAGNYFMNGKDLAPRDVVARHVFLHRANGHQTFLDISGFSERFSDRFPSISAACNNADIDLSSHLIPVKPAAHYHMGGVKVDEMGRTNIDGLFAAGEVACTGLHGANRLASNSLLEAVVCGQVSGRFMAAQGARRTGVLQEITFPAKADATEVRDIMSDYCGVLRSGKALEIASGLLGALAPNNPAAALSLKIVEAALERKDSVGSHMRVEFSMEKAA